MHRGAFVVRRVKVFAERRAERGLISLGDDNPVEHRRPFALAAPLCSNFLSVAASVSSFWALRWASANGPAG